MDRSVAVSRRALIRTGIATGVLGSLAGGSEGIARGAWLAPGGRPDPWRGLKVGVATYSLSRFPLDPALVMLKRVGVGYASIKEAHLPLKSSAEQRQAVVAKFRAIGVNPISCGVVNMNDDPADMRNAFEYARDAGLPTIVAKPTRKSLAALEALVKEFDIKVAIHNHGPEDKVWPSPLDVWEAIGSLDPRIGVCIDVGHTARCGVDPADAVRKCSTRLYDMHLKDLDSTEPKARTVEVGRGALDIAGILAALLDIKYAYHVGLEYEKDMGDPLAGIAESIGNLRGTLAGLRRV